ncbi:MAG: hypothetical protein JNG89_21645 [Planctomycetaceae bacterium]|nr:hypothetical protein [Planctomycetaceae bacterium]
MLPPVRSPADRPAAAVVPPWTPHKFRAPTGDGELAVQWIGGDLEQSRAAAVALSESELDLQGRSLGRLRVWAREDCLRAAAEYTSQLTGETVAAPAVDAPLFVAGHQPQLFHAGVWVKNFVVGGLAERSGGLGLNLIVDNDTLSRTGVLAPAGSAAVPHFETIHYDEPRPPQPWEDAPIVNEDLFEKFRDRASVAMSAWGIAPIIAEMWPAACRVARAGGRLVDALVATRRCQEQRWGLSNLELPVSRMCEQRSFLWFACHVLAQLPRFREIHNAVLWEYRAVNRIRSRSHPVPELGEQDGWLEAPFWVWRSGDLRRRHVFARQQGAELALSDGVDEFARIPLGPDREACCAVEALERLPSQGIRFRTRALTTTLFARIVLGDLFVHGIGGAKYDEMTDRIIAQFYGLAPPPFLMATATLRLPLPSPPAWVGAAVGRLRHALRDTQFNPDRHGGTAPDSWALRRRELLAEQHAARTSGLTRSQRRARRTENRERAFAFRDLRNELTAITESARLSLRVQLAAAEQQTAARAVLASREYSACLFPEAMLAELFNRARA